MAADAYLITSEMPDLLPQRHRSVGPHVSEGISHLCVQLGHFDAIRSFPVAWGQLGCALEWATIERLQRHCPGRFAKGRELQRDGVYGTPDIIDTQPYLDDLGRDRRMPAAGVRPLGPGVEAALDEDGITVEEVKMAWAGARHHPDDEKLWRYKIQLHCYCWQARTRVGRLRVMHVNGLNDGKGPRYFHYEWAWEVGELAETWALVSSAAKRAYRGEFPALPPRPLMFKRGAR